MFYSSVEPPVLVEGLSLCWALATLNLLTVLLLVGIAPMLLVDGLEEPDEPNTGACSGESACGLGTCSREATGGLGPGSGEATGGLGTGSGGLGTGSGESTDVESDVEEALTLFFDSTLCILVAGLRA